MHSNELQTGYRRCRETVPLRREEGVGSKGTKGRRDEIEEKLGGDDVRSKGKIYLFVCKSINRTKIILSTMCKNNL